MNKKVMIGIGIILLAVLFVVFKIIIPDTTGSKTIELTYKTNGGVPYKWEYKIEDESIVQFVETKDITSENDKNLAGGPVSINYIFKGLKEGKTTVTFKYVNITNGSIEKEDKVTLKVDKNQNISLVLTDKSNDSLSNDDSNSVLLNKTIYTHPYKEVIKIEANGKLYKSKIVDELTIDGAPKDQFNYIKTISNDDLVDIKSIINQMKTEEKKRANYSKDYGIAVNLGEDVLYGCEYFSQEAVDKLNSIIKKYE